MRSSQRLCICVPLLWFQGPDPKFPILNPVYFPSRTQSSGGKKVAEAMKQQRLDDYSMFGLFKNLDEMDQYMQDLDLNKHLDELRYVGNLWAAGQMKSGKSEPGANARCQQMFKCLAARRFRWSLFHIAADAVHPRPAGFTQGGWRARAPGSGRGRSCAHRRSTVTSHSRCCLRPRALATATTSPPAGCCTIC